MQVNKVMNPHPHYINEDGTLRDAAVMMREHQCGMVAIGREQRLVGIITDHDIVTRAVAGGLGADTPAAECMTDRILYCYAGDELGDVARNMAQQQVQRLIVLDNKDSKKLAGVISVSDIAAVSRDDARLAEALSGCSQRYSEQRTH